MRRAGRYVLWSSNFSIGVNILFRVSEYLARIMDRFPEYAVSMREVHHTSKKGCAERNGCHAGRGYSA